MANNHIVDSLIALAGQDRVVVVHKAFVQFTGSLEAALMFGQLLYWTPRSTSGWIARTDKGWMDEIWLSQYKVRQARSDLEEMGVLETDVRKFAGNPSVHYRIKQDVLAAAWEEFIGTEEQERDGFRDSFLRNRKNVLSFPKERSCENVKSSIKNTIENTIEKDFPDEGSTDEDLAALSAASSEYIGERPASVRVGVEQAFISSLSAKGSEEESSASQRKSAERWLREGFGALFCQWNGSSVPDSTMTKKNWVSAAARIAYAARTHVETWGEAYALAEEAVAVLFGDTDSEVNAKAWLVAAEDKRVQFTGLPGAEESIVDTIGRIAARRKKEAAKGKPSDAEWKDVTDLSGGQFSHRFEKYKRRRGRGEDKENGQE
jgi:hypothetical protein